MYTHMVRKVHSEGLRERQNMRDATQHQKDGDWCVVGFNSNWEDTFGLQGWGYESEQVAKEVMDEVDNDPEFAEVEHKVMTHSDYEELCEKEGVDRNYPWK